MEIEAGKYYKTRDGRKVQICGVMRDVAQSGFAGAFQMQEYWEAAIWYGNGSYEISGRSTLDIIGEWKEPVSKTAEILLVRTSVGKLRFIESPLSHPNVIARKTVTITEGEGREAGK